MYRSSIEIFVFIAGVRNIKFLSYFFENLLPSAVMCRYSMFMIYSSLINPTAPILIFLFHVELLILRIFTHGNLQDIV